MTNVKKCDRCGEIYETWSRFGRKLPKAKVKEKRGFNRFVYLEADLCKDCSKALSEFMEMDYE